MYLDPGTKWSVLGWKKLEIVPDVECIWIQGQSGVCQGFWKSGIVLDIEYTWTQGQNMAWTAFWKQEIVPGRWQEASQGQKEWKQTKKEKGIVAVRIRVPSQRQQRGNIRHLGTLWKGVNLLQFSHTARIRCATATSRFGRAPYASNRNKTTMWASSQLFLFLFEAHGWTVQKLCKLSEINKKQKHYWQFQNAVIL